MVAILASPGNGLAEIEPLPGTSLALSVSIRGRLGRLLVSVQSFEEERAVESQSRRIRKLTSEQIKRASEAMRMQLQHGVRLSAIASLVGLSPSHFSRSFRKSVGVTFTAFLQRLRIEEAMRLMMETDSSLCEVALASGYGDQSMFSRSFTRAVGVTPFRWRLLHQQ